jgi:hypothetical protein
LHKILAIKRRILSPRLGPIFFPKATILSYLSHRCYLDDVHNILNDFVDPPKIFFLEGGNVGVVEDNMRLSYEIVEDKMTPLCRARRDISNDM